MTLMELIAADVEKDADTMQRALNLARAAFRAEELKRAGAARIRSVIAEENSDIDPQTIAIAVDEIGREESSIQSD